MYYIQNVLTGHGSFPCGTEGLVNERVIDNDNINRPYLSSLSQGWALS
jgi:hypothetical protein